MDDGDHEINDLVHNHPLLYDGGVVVTHLVHDDELRFRRWVPADLLNVHLLD